MKNVFSVEPRLLSLVFLSLLAATSAAQQPWAGFRGPTGMGVSQSSNLPLEWSESENIAWKTALPGPGSSSPIVFGDHVYVTCYSGYFVPGQSGGSVEDLQRHLVCLDRATGKILWQKAVAAKLPEEERIRDHGYAGNTPAADDDHVYVFWGKTGVQAYTHEGQPKWTADVGSGTHGWGTSASPLLVGDLVIINASVESGRLVALDRNTGEERWSVDGMREAWNTPVLVDSTQGRELVVATFGKVRAFDPSSGKPLWTCDTDITWYMVPSVVAEEGIVYVLGGRSGVAALAVKSGGRGDVTATHRLWKSNKGSNVTSPVVRDGHLYWMHEKLGIAYCAVGETGELKYEQRINRAGQVYGSALLAGDRVYYTNRGGRTFVVAANPSYELLATNDLRDGSTFNASPAVDGNRLLIRSDKFLYCIGD